MDQVMTFVQDRWMLIVGAIIALFIIVKIVKTVVKWVIVLVIVAGLLLYGAQYMGDLKEVSAKVADYTKEEAVKALVGEAKDAQYEQNADGTFTITSKHAELQGTLGSDEGTLTLYHQSFKVKIDNTLKKIIEQSRINPNPMKKP